MTVRRVVTHAATLREGGRKETHNKAVDRQAPKRQVLWNRLSRLGLEGWAQVAELADAPA